MRYLTDTSGFSLLESMIGCALLATALLSIGHLTSGAIVLLADARNRTVATTLAVAKLEELRGSATPGAGSDTVDSRGEPAATGTSRRFDRSWEVEAVAGGSMVTVAVAPVPRGIAGREVRITGGWMPMRR
jgi:Tfp pilus assembly protein PilV